jgi:F-type H+-transporting ATPase subunit b
MGILNFTFIGEIITFIVLVWFTMKFIWPPVIKAINERQRKIAEGLEAAERGRASLEVSQQQAIKIINQAKKEAVTIIAEAKQQVVEIVEHGKVKAQEEADRLLVLAKSDVEKEKAAAKQELRKQVAILAVMAAEKIIQANINPAINQQLIEQLFAEI